MYRLGDQLNYQTWLTHSLTQLSSIITDILVEIGLHRLSFMNDKYFNA
jgi:hypothetical protein